MYKILIKFLGGLCCLFAYNANAQNVQSWAVYYTDKASISEFEPFDLLVLDSDYHPALNRLVNRNKILYGYISLGEVEHERFYFDAIKSEGILLDENKNWPGSYFVDVRDPKWPKRVIEEIIPHILQKPFDGLFFDTLDNFAYLESKDPVKYKGMLEACINLVKAIRRHYPDIKIMMNRAYEMLPKVSNIIDAQLGESVYSGYDFANKTHQQIAPTEYQWQVMQLQNAKRINPRLQIYTLDYWDMDDVAGIQKIYKIQRDNGFIPYVSTVELNKLFPEP